MMGLTESLEVLRLDQSQATDALAIEAAFQKLARRYPPEFFGEKFQVIRDARETLLQGGVFWTRLVQDDRIRLGWLAKYVRLGESATVDVPPLEHDAVFVLEMNRRVMPLFVDGPVPEFFADRDGDFDPWSDDDPDELNPFNW
jgi:hypothetical protein